MRAGQVMPETVVDQLHLWARERHRLRLAQCYLYERFNSVEEFEATEKYAKDTGAHLWSRRAEHGPRCALAVRAATHKDMKLFIRKWRAEHAAPMVT